MSLLLEAAVGEGIECRLHSANLPPVLRVQETVTAAKVGRDVRVKAAGACVFQVLVEDLGDVANTLAPYQECPRVIRPRGVTATNRLAARFRWHDDAGGTRRSVILIAAPREQGMNGWCRGRPLAPRGSPSPQRSGGEGIWE
jgi:hypothetical protein